MLFASSCVLPARPTTGLAGPTGGHGCMHARRRRSWTSFRFGLTAGGVCPTSRFPGRELSAAQSSSSDSSDPHLPSYEVPWPASCSLDGIVSSCCWTWARCHPNPAVPHLLFALVVLRWMALMAYKHPASQIVCCPLSPSCFLIAGFLGSPNHQPFAKVSPDPHSQPPRA